MAKTCDICHRGPSTTFMVSHAHNRTKRRVFLNLQRVRVKVGKRVQRVDICTKCLKSGRVAKA